MKVILLKTIQGTGKVGEVKTVPDGYARNFLFAKGLAKPANENIVKEMEVKKKKQEKKAKKAKKESSKAMRVLDNQHISIKANKNDSGVLFAAVKPESIIKELNNKFKVKINPTDIIFEKPIKNVGEHKVSIKFGQGNKAIVKLTVF